MNAVDPFGLEVLSPDMIQSFAPNVDTQELADLASSGVMIGGGVGVVACGAAIVGAGVAEITHAGPPGWLMGTHTMGEGDVTVESVVNNLRFAGQYYDAETGLHYNYQRYYDPALGRYLTPDPIGLAGGINLYSYTDQNPINAIDPFGLARYYISYTIKSYSAVVVPAGMSKITGLVVSTQRNSDGTYNAIKFEGKFYGATLGPLPWSATINNEEYFEDDCEKADVTNIEGKSWYLSGSMALWKLGVSGGGYKFGNLMGTKETTSSAEGLDLGVDFMIGRTWTVGPILKYDAGIFPENR